MSKIGGAGRAEFLQDIIVKGVICAVEKKELPPDWVRDIFGDALKDATIRARLLGHWGEGPFQKISYE